MQKFTIREEMVRCGRAGCKSCPHGPYRYKYWRENGVLKKKYLGKPEDQVLFTDDGEPIETPAHEEALPTEREILGVPNDASFTQCRRAFRKLTALIGPRGTKPDSLRYVLVKAAWKVLRGNRR